MRLPYSQETKDLIIRMCKIAEREDFVLNKKKGLECLLKTYDLFGLSYPKKIVWVKDVFDKRFKKAVKSVWSKGLASGAVYATKTELLANLTFKKGSAYSAEPIKPTGSIMSKSLAMSAWWASSARIMGAARAVSLIWIALITKPTMSIRPTRSIKFAGLDWTAIDCYFNWYVYENEYCKNRKDNPGPEPNENDYKYLKYLELLLKAKEYGVGYQIEWNDTLYIAPTPLVKLDEKDRLHSTKIPAIRWKGGHKFYFLHGVNFEKNLWKKIVKGKLTDNQLFKIKNIEQRRIAYEFMDKTKMKALKDYKQKRSTR